MPESPRAFEMRQMKPTELNARGYLELTWQQPAETFGPLRGFRLEYFEISPTGERIVNSGGTLHLLLSYLYKIESFGTPSVLTIFLSPS